MTHSRHLEVLIATGNRGKVLEIQQSLQRVPIILRHLREFHDILAADEVGETYEENAMLKALSYSKQAGIFALADDSGLEVDALGGMPGIFSARHGGENASDQERTAELLKSLNQYPHEKRTARFVCCMVLAGWPSKESQISGADPQVLYRCQANCEGRIADAPRGTNGFGYDPVFCPMGYDRTFAELPSAVKNAISHRAQALAAMRDFLNGWIA